MPTRVLAPVVTVLAAFGLLVFFYVSLAVIAKTAAGTAAIEPACSMGAIAAPTEWGPAALLVSLAIAFAGFEIPTAASHRLRSISRPLAYAMALVVLCATLAWVATNMATAGDFRYNAGDLTQVAAALFGMTSGFWLLLAATMVQAVAALLVLIWGATRVVRPPVPHSPLPLAVTAVVTTLLALALSFDWAGAAGRLWGVAGILLFVVYLAAAQANSRSDDSNTTAWAVFALTGVVLVVVVFLHGATDGWWPVAIAAAIVVAAAAVGQMGPLRQSGKPNNLMTP